MSFISSASHRKFILQCQHLVTDPAGQKQEQLKADIQHLQQLAETYLELAEKIPAIVREYNILHKRIRVKARKLKNKTP